MLRRREHGTLDHMVPAAWRFASGRPFSSRPGLSRSARYRAFGRKGKRRRLIDSEGNVGHLWRREAHFALMTAKLCHRLAVICCAHPRGRKNGWDEGFDGVAANCLMAA